MIPRTQRIVDQSIIKVSQSATIFLMVLSFIFDSWTLVALVAIVNLLGVLSPQLSMWRQLYLHVLKPTGIIQSRIMDDNPEPHRFAQGVGGLLAGISAILLDNGWNVMGWLLGWLLIVLAALNVVAGFCLGCFLYYQMNRLGVPGFSHSPVETDKGHRQSDDRI